MDKINFPINFNAIGLDYKMTYAHFGYSNDVAYLRQHCQEAVQDTIQSRETELLVGGELRVEGDSYRIVKSLASGSFGTTAIVQNSKGMFYCLKRQIIYNKKVEIKNSNELKCYKEAMMHHILDFHTRTFMDYKSDLIPTLYHVVRSNIESGPIYFIMDLMSSSLLNRLASLPSDHDKLLEFVRCLAHITPTLLMLYTNGLYNHGDLHMGNIMYDRLSGRYRLIDYGFSRIRIGTGAKHHILALDAINMRSDASRDLTQLIFDFEMSYRINEMEYTVGSFEYSVQKMIHHVVNGQCPGSYPIESEHSHNFMEHSWESSYDYFNKHTNLNGTHDMIQSYINSLPSPSVVSASAVRRPTSYSSSSAASSVAVRTPRVAKAASAAVRVEEIGQLNIKNPGCMMILLLIMIFTMGGAAWVYYGRGGKIHNSIIFNDSSNHSLSNYPKISFQYNHSMNIKSRKNKNSFKKLQSLSNSKRNTRRRSHKITQATIEDFDKLSLVSFYHYLRVHAFPDVLEKDKKKMLQDAVMVPLQRDDIFSQIVKAVSRNQFDQMMEILQKNRLDLGDVEQYQEIWNRILDAYFEEKDYPIELLQTLLHIGGQVEDFLERYRSSNKGTKKMMVMQTCITSSDYPEMMLE